MANTPITPSSASALPVFAEGRARARLQRPPPLNLAAMRRSQGPGDIAHSLDARIHSAEAEPMRMAGDSVYADRKRRQTERKLSGIWRSAPVTPRTPIQPPADMPPLPPSIQRALSRPPLKPRPIPNTAPLEAPKPFAAHAREASEDSSSGSSFACRGLGASTPDECLAPLVQVSRWSLSSGESDANSEAAKPRAPSVTSDEENEEAGRLSLQDFQHFLRFHDAPLSRSSSEATPLASHSPVTSTSPSVRTPLASSYETSHSHEARAKTDA